MCRPQKDPLRSLSQEERKMLEQFSCCLTQPTDQVIHAKEVLAVADGHTFTDAATLAERKSGAVAHLVPASIKKGFSLWKHDMEVAYPFSTHRWSVNTS